jgi:hypothetical protein
MPPIRSLAAALAIVGPIVLLSAPSHAGDLDGGFVAFGLSAPASTVSADATVEVSAQSRRPRTRIRVTPRYREGNSPYPRVNPVAYPGPNARRECVARYVQERRPSGTVIVPRMHCWWVRG